jgi:hypothetical protein
VEIRQAAEEVVDPADDLNDQVPAPAAKEEDRQLNKAIEILKDPSRVTATRKAA